MDAIRKARARLERAERAEVEARRAFFVEVERAHSAGASLAELAKDLGVTRARVHQMVKVVRDEEVGATDVGSADDPAG